jgi:hypothetical protein
MNDKITSTPEEILGAEFWTQPEGLLDPEFSLMASLLASAFKDERRAQGPLTVEDIVLIERFSFCYSFLRQREARIEDSMADRTRREMNKDIIDLLIMMKKLWTAEDKENAQDVILRRVQKAVSEAVKDMPPAEGRRVQALLADSFQSSGL